MKTLLISMIVGVAAGIIDNIPMILQKMDKHSIISAFLQYFFVSVIIVNIDLPGIKWWFQGGIISLALASPIILIVSGTDKNAIPVIASMSLILGTMIGIAGHYLK